MSNGIGHVWAVNAEGGDEGRPNGVGPVWIENADQLGSKLPEPESGDAGKVLGVLNADGDIGWVPDQEGMAQVQADWDQTDSSQVSYIANKPSLATVATTGAYSDLSGTPTIPTVDQTYDASSTNAQSGVAVAGAVATKQDTISDLETIRSGAAAGATAVQPGSLATVATSGSYSDLSNKPTIPTVDQTYNAASTNAQSGTAVAQAIAAIPSSSYTAGYGISISGTTLNTKVDGKGLKYNNQAIDLNLATNSGLSYDQQQATASLTVGGSASLDSIRFNNTDLNSYLNSATSGQTFSLTIPANLFTSYALMYPGDRILFVFSNYKAGTSGATTSYIDVTDQLSYTSDELSGTTINACTITLPAYLYASAGWSYDVSSHNYGYFAKNDPLFYFSSGSGSVTASYPGSLSGLKVTNPLPSSTSADEDKVLTVNSSGNAVWAAAQGGSSYTAGDGINIDSNDRISVNPDSTLKSVYTTRYQDISRLENIGQNAPAYIDLEGMHRNEVLEHVINDFPLDSSIQVNVLIGEGLYCDSLGQGSDVKAYLIFSDDPNFNGFYATPYELSTTYSTLDNRWYIQPQTVVVATPIVSHGVTVVGVRPTNTLCYVSFAFGTSRSALTTSTVARQDYQALVQLRITYPDYTSPIKIGVSNPLPTSAVGDAGKVLKVDSNGDPEWATGGAQADWTEADPSDPSYVQNKPDVLDFVAGSGISITESASSITIAADAQIPPYSTTTDVGKVLQVTANGLEWVTLS